MFFSSAKYSWWKSESKLLRNNTQMSQASWIEFSCYHKHRRAYSSWFENGFNLRIPKRLSLLLECLIRRPRLLRLLEGRTSEILLHLHVMS